MGERYDIPYRSVEAGRNPREIRLFDHGDERWVFLHGLDIESVAVDWLPESGHIIVRLRSGRQYRIHFTREDAGEECSAGLDVLLAAMNGET